jgi:DNA-binding NtrC family response regulator
MTGGLRGQLACYLRHMPRSTLLVIDDEPNILSSLRRALEIEGYGVEVAGSGPVALAKLDERDIDLVMLDVVMPEMNGLEVLARIRDKHPDVAVVMMSGNATIETAVQATKLGAHDFVEKPLSRDKLLLTVQNTLRYAGLRRENERLAAQARGDFAMIGGSQAMRTIFDKIAVTAPTNGRVLITGENGTGKELVARAIHDHSKRKKEPFVKLNCAAIPSELIESELFGHEKGAFTGATQQRRGKFELADGGTLFLDEVGDMNPNAQAKVLRVLQEGELERVGGDETIKTDVRVIAATNKDLAAEIAGQRFREDLYYRLNVVPIHLPSLRERREDVPTLVEHFLAVECRANERRPKRIASGAVSMLMQYDWPGNVRELKNLIERLVILTGEAEVIGEADVTESLPGIKAVRGSYRRGMALKDLVAAAERDLILEALTANDHHISNTARELQLERSHLYKKMRALGINPRAGDEPE